MVENQGFLAVTFQICDTWCGVDTVKVQEVGKLGRVTPVRHAEGYVIGVINLRGKIITIIDLGLKIGIRKVDITDETRVLIVPWSGEQLGIIVDRVADVVQVEQGEMTERPSVSGGIPSEFFSGVLNREDRLIGILNMDSILRLDSETQGGE